MKYKQLIIDNGASPLITDELITLNNFKLSEYRQFFRMKQTTKLTNDSFWHLYKLLNTPKNYDNLSKFEKYLTTIE